MLGRDPGRKCAKCKITAAEDAKLRFHRFPLPGKRGTLKARIWAEYSYPGGDWSTQKSLNELHVQHKMLCSKHFDDSSYTGSDRRRLNNFAIPTDAQDLLAKLRQEQNASSQSQMLNINIPTEKPQVPPVQVSTSILSSLLKCSHTRSYANRNIMKLSDRGMYQDLFPNTAAKEIVNLLNKSPQCVYAGFDPTANSLHVGNLLVIINLLHWQRAGHKVIALLGGATGHIGDPSGRSTDRVAIQTDVIQENINSIRKNLETVFENHKKYIWEDDQSKLNDVKIVNNEDWYRSIDSIKFVSDIGRNFRMGTMLLKQSVQTRIHSEVGMSFTEFAYQIFQSYDWLHLLKEYDCRFQIGGSDQMGNISAGHELISRTAKRNVYGLTLPLVTTEEGDKFGKSAGNALWLDPSKTTPYALYQYFIRTKDSDVERLLKLFTFYSLGEIKDIMVKHQLQPDQRYPQTCLAEQLTVLVHGEKGLARARRATEAIYSKDVKSLVSLDCNEIEQVFEGAPVTNLLLSPGITVFQLGMMAKCFPTESDALRIIQAGGFYINHQRVKHIDEVITESVHILPNMISLLRVGKRNYHIIKWQT